jgi:hypothetical protein
VSGPMGWRAPSTLRAGGEMSASVRRSGLWWSPRSTGGATPKGCVGTCARLTGFDLPVVTLLVACIGGTAKGKLVRWRLAFEADRRLAGFEHRSGVEGRTGAD